MSSFPVPLSPWIRTVARLWETTPIVLKMSRMAFVGADDVAHLVIPGGLREQAADFLFRLQGLEGLLQRDLELVDIDRLVDVVEGAGLHGPDRRVHVVEGRDHDDLHILIVFPESPREP